MLLIIVAFISLIFLMIVHELGHFIFAKKFGVKVEEFGIGYPPRIIGKKIGETIYSLNLVPFGAFVRIYGEEKRVPDSRSFSQKPIWQRALIILGGVFSFWIISAILLSIVLGIGAPVAISDEEKGNLTDPKVQITIVAPGSPAELSGLRLGDAIKEFKIPAVYAQQETYEIKKVGELQNLVEKHKGREVILTIEREKELIDVSLVPRVVAPEGQGAMGVGLARTAIKSYPWHLAPFYGILATGNLTVAIVQGLFEALINAIKGVPSGVQVMGPVGIFSLFSQAGSQGVVYFLQFIALISAYLAIFNILPIPAVDGGRLLFLIIEKIRKKPFNEKFEQNINAVFFTLLIALMIFVTIKDIQNF